MKSINTGAEFLNLVFKDMKDSIKSDISDPSQKIMKYLERLEILHKDSLSYENKKMILRSFCYDKYIIKKLPDSYIKYRKGYFYALGLRDKKEITENDKALVLECIKSEQKQSLDNLLDFLSSNQNNYPTWFKYYLFQSITKVGKFYPIVGEFTKRSSSTTETFMLPDKNVVNEMYILICKYLFNEYLSLEEREIISKGLNFRNLYIKIYRKNNKKNNIFSGTFDDDLEEHVGPAVLYEAEKQGPIKRVGK